MNLIQKFKDFLDTEGEVTLTRSYLKFVRNQRGIAEICADSERYGTLVGVYCAAFGQGMFLTAVQSVRSNGEIIFHPCDVTGQKLIRNVVSLDEIKMVCPLNDQYSNSICKKLQFAAV